MSATVQPNAGLIVNLTSILASADWTAMKLHLSKANIVPNKATVLTDLSADEADFVGYVAASLTFSAPFIDGLGNVRATALASFLASSGATPNTLYTYYVTNTAGSKLIFSGVLDGSPISILVAGDGISMVVSPGVGAGEVTVVG